MKAKQIIDMLGLEPLDFEGGFARRTYTSGREMNNGRHLSSAIYYLLTPDTHSRIHRVEADEMFHFYLGDPVEMWNFKDGGAERVILGGDIFSGQKVQHLVPSGMWQGSRLVEGGRFALLGATVTPAFTMESFEGLNNVKEFKGEYHSELHTVIDMLK